MQFYTECIVVGSRSEIKVGIFDFVLDGSVGSGQICAAVGRSLIFITSTKEVMFYPAFVRLFVCLSVR